MFFIFFMQKKDMGASTRKREQNRYFCEKITKILEAFLFVAQEWVWL